MFKFVTEFNYITKVSYFSDNSDWKLIDNNSSVNCGLGMCYTYEVRLTIRRHPVYYFVVIILPTLMFCVLNPLVFILPVESGERVSLAITILLSYSIFLTLVSASIPATSNPMSFLLITMIVIILISGLILAFVILSTNLYYTEQFENVKCSVIILSITRDRHKMSQTQIISGKDLSKSVDKLFLILSYVLFLMVHLSYIVVILNF